MGDRIYYVYIMASRSRNLYTGMTNTLERRVYQHKRGLIPGFTRRYRLERLVYYEAFQDVRAAIAREKQIKAWTRAKRIALIESRNPTWHDFAEDAAKRWERVEAALNREASKAKRNADPSLRSG
jgi:putative endonuclease